MPVKVIFGQPVNREVEVPNGVTQPIDLVTPGVRVFCNREGSLATVSHQSLTKSIEVNQDLPSVSRSIRVHPRGIISETILVDVRAELLVRGRNPIVDFDR